MTTDDKGVILIVDDILTNLEVLFDCLAGAGFRILVAENGESAIQKAKYAVPDLVLLDILMPGMDGFETCRRLKADEVTAAIPIIFMTALTEMADKVTGFNLGAVDYITKPFQQEEVLARVQTHLRLQQLTQQLRDQNQKLEQEIWERQQTEEERDRFFTLSLDLLCILDFEGNLKRFNPAFEAVLGYTHEELENQPFFNLIHCDDQTATHIEFEKLKAAIPVIDFENRYRTKDGAYRWLSWRASSVPEAGLIYAIARDITTAKHIESERLQLLAREQAVRNEAETQRNRVTDILESITDGFFALDHQWQFTYVNSQAEVLLQRKRGELLGKNVWNEFPMSLRSAFRTEYHRAVEEQISVEFEAFYQPLDAWFAVHAYPTKDGLSVYFQTINERKQAEQALRETTTLQRAILNSANYTIISTTQEGTILTFNAAAERLLGYTAAEVVGKTTPVLIHDRDEVIQRAAELSQELGEPIAPGFETFVAKARRGTVDEREWSYIRKDGSRFPVLLSITALRDAENKITGFLGIGSDITERKHAENALRESEERFHQAFENAAIGMALVSLEGRWLQVNRALCQMVGYSEQELLATDVQTITHPDDLAKGLNFLQQAASGETSYFQCEKRYLHKQGHVVWVMLSSSLIRDVQGHPLYTVTQIEDITERKRTQEELQRQNLRAQLFSEVTLKIRQSLQLQEILQTTVTEIQQLLQADRVLVFQLWLDGSGQVVQEAVVPGYPVTLGQNFNDPCFNEEYLEQYQQGRIGAIANIETAGIQPCYVEFLQQINVRANLVVPIFVRDVLWGLLIAHQCSHPRQWTAFETELLRQLANQIGIAIAQAQLLEQETRQRQELARSNSELQQFAYIASHDLQEPLRMVSSYLQLLERRYHDRLDADANDFIAYAVDGAARMKTLISDLLAYSRVGTRGQPFELVDCSEVMKRVLKNLKVVIDEKHATVTYDPLPQIMADPTQMSQLFQNLISNAIKFHGANPPSVHISAERQNDMWLFSVRDNGIGIEPQYAERIFVIFQRLHNRADYPGTGIGLAICKKIIERHGGMIWVASEIDNGSTFCFTIPDRDKRSSWF